VKVNFATDSSSSAGGLAAVAYNDPDFFREVKNQIIQQSPTDDLDLNLPSSLFSGAFDQGDKVRQLIKEGLDNLNLFSQDFNDWLAVNNRHTTNSLSKLLELALFQEFDRISSYMLPLEGYISSAIRQLGLNITPELAKSAVEMISNKFKSDPRIGPEVSDIVSVMNNNPFTKISSIPPDTILSLEKTSELDKDYRGVSLVNGYLTPDDYYNNVGFPKNLNAAVNAGYVGYPQTPLESLYNPASSTPLGSEETKTTSLTEAMSNLSSDSRLSQADRDLYNLSLMSIDLKGLTSYDPATMSSGDLLDISLLPKAEEANLDPNKGLLPYSRTKQSAF